MCTQLVTNLILLLVANLILPFAELSAVDLIHRNITYHSTTKPEKSLKSIFDANFPRFLSIDSVGIQNASKAFR